MKIGTMFRDVGSALVHRPVTERYPFERHKTPLRLRGRLHWDPSQCTGCGLCVIDCPANAIELTVLDKKSKQFVLTYHLDRCTFCAQCVESCRHGCLEMSASEWELALLSKDAFTLYFGDQADVDAVLEGTASPVIDEDTAPG